jgi:hypothetical protein
MSPIILLSHPTQDDLHVWSCFAEDHVIAVPPNAPVDQDDGCPQVSLSRLGTGPRVPPLKELHVRQRKPG